MQHYRGGWARMAILAVVIFLAAAGIVAYHYWPKLHPQDQTISSGQMVSAQSTTTGWTRYVDPNSDMAFNYPNDWVPHSAGSGAYFTSNGVGVLDLTQLSASGTLEQVAQEAILENNCPALDQNGNPVDRIINSSSRGVLFVLSCSATTDDYDYITHSPKGGIVEMAFHDAFPADTPSDQTPAPFLAIIASTY